MKTRLCASLSLATRVLALCVAAAIFVVGCGAGEDDDEVVVDNDEEALSERVEVAETDIEIEETPIEGAMVHDRRSRVRLRLLATVRAPRVRRQTVQAASVALHGTTAAVSFNMRGGEYLGALEFIDVRRESRPRVKSQARYRNADVHAVVFDAGQAWAALGSNMDGLTSPAAVSAISRSGSKLKKVLKTAEDLNSFAATSVASDGERVFVTTGNTGGLHVLDAEDLSSISVIPLDDARWVDVSRRWVVVAQGTPGRLAVYDAEDLHHVGTFPVDGATIAESKSTVEIVGRRVYMAAGDGGTVIMSLPGGDVVATVPRPNVPRLDTAVTVTNSATVDDDLLFMSNGEAGVYLARTRWTVDRDRDEDEDEGEDEEPAVELLGRLSFRNLESANHVVYRDGMLLVAAGLGGLKVVQVTGVDE